MAFPIIFEGTDKAGKTSTLEAVRKLRPDWSLFTRPKQVKDTKPVDGWIDACDIDVITIDRMEGMSNRYALVDRVPHFSEPVYGKVMEGNDHLAFDGNFGLWQQIDRNYVQAGAILVYCFASPKIIEHRWNKGPDPYMKLEHIRPLQEGYLRVLSETKLATITINTGVCTPEHAAVQIIKFIEKGVRGHYAHRGDQPRFAVGTLLHHHGLPSSFDPLDPFEQALQRFLQGAHRQG